MSNTGDSESWFGDLILSEGDTVGCFDHRAKLNIHNDIIEMLIAIRAVV